MSKKVMLIGAGGVAGVAAAKMCQNPETFGELLIASRTEARCKAIKKDIEKRPWYRKGKTRTKITTAQIDAMDNVELSPGLDPTGRSTALACKFLRECLLALA